MSARKFTVIEQPEGGCLVLVDVAGLAVGIELTSDEAIDLGGQLLDGASFLEEVA